MDSTTNHNSVNQNINWITYPVVALCIGFFGLWFGALFFGGSAVDMQMERDPQFCKNEAMKKTSMPIIGAFFEIAYDKCKLYNTGQISGKGM